VFPVYGFFSRYFGPLANTSRREVLLMMLSSPVITIYECGICTGAISWFRLEVFSVWFLQHILVVKYFGCKKCGIGIRDYRNRLIFKIGFVTWLTRWVPLVEQELLTLHEHPSSPLVFSGVRVTRSLVLYVCFVDRCLSFCTFSFGHCAVCSTSIYGFWLPFWYLQTLLRFDWFMMKACLG
jgi:hypothetical protein